MKRAAVLLAVLVASGCVGETDPPPARDPRDLGGPASGTMTASLRTETRDIPCGTGPLPVPALANRFCTLRFWWLEGEARLDRFPAAVDVFRGNATLAGSSSPRWNVSFTVGAFAATQQEARDEAARAQLAWSHEEGLGYFLRANLSRPFGCAQCVVADARLAFPSQVPAAVSLTTREGAIAARGLDAAPVVLRAPQGSVGAQLEGRDVVVEAAGPEAYLRFEARAAGRVEVSNEAGPVEFAVLEGRDLGNLVRARSLQGPVDVRLRDGVASADGEHTVFRSHDYASRSIRTEAALAATHGILVRNAAELGA